MLQKNRCVASTNIVTTDFNPLINTNNKIRTVGSIHITSTEQMATNTTKSTCKLFAEKNRMAVIDKTWSSKLFGVVGHLINEANCKKIL